MRLLLVRHGQTVGNIEGRIQGGDDPLTDLGQAQARVLAAHIAKTHAVTHLYASPLDRALETATIIGQAIDREPVPIAGLAEIDAGRAVGLLWVEWRDENPDLAELMASQDRSLDAGWQGGESGRQFGDRVIAAYNEIVTRHVGTSDVVVAVGHGGSLAWIAAHAHGDPMDIWPGARAGFHNCSISILDIDDDGHGTPGPWNQVAHLEGLDPA
ncbi:MAG TPA: histidine phosphatase family protein [Thermomicrobiales bacterium]|nr:histidine phosphatase family protein [Thermomicrobiales bacterium]